MWVGLVTCISMRGRGVGYGDYPCELHGLLSAHGLGSMGVHLDLDLIIAHDEFGGAIM